MATVYHERTIVASTLKIGITQNASCDNVVGFLKSGHILTYFNMYVANRIQTFIVCASIKVDSNTAIRSNIVMFMHVE